MILKEYHNICNCKLIKYDIHLIDERPIKYK